MSGIVGILHRDGAPVDDQLLEALTAAIAWRGPDAQATWRDGPVGLGHTMLRTTWEQADERQPCSLDGVVWITADARVDGRAELQRKLSAKGGEGLEGATDVELILHAYHVWGEACVAYLLGDFAFAIWDGRARRLFCARDHFGVKPFFYTHKDGMFAFSNDLTCLRGHPAVSDELNELAIADFLMFGQNQEVDTSAFADIQRLAPAHTLLVGPDTPLLLRRYWRLPVLEAVHYKRKEEYIERFRELFEQAVSDRLRTDKVGIWMSGGLDSTSVAAVAWAAMKQGAGEPVLRAYTNVYDRLIPDQERYYAGEAAAHIGIPIKYQISDDYPLFGPWDACDKGRLQTPEPADLSFQDMWLDFWHHAWSRERVMLTGYGGDPALYPEHRYVVELIKQAKLGQLLSEVGRFWHDYGRRPPLYLGTWWREKRGVNRHQPPFPEGINLDFAGRMQLKERWDDVYARDFREPDQDGGVRPRGRSNLSANLWPFLFENNDPAGAIPPLETRHPFFDVRLISYFLALPPIPWCVDKILLREAMSGFLPERIRLRPKAPLAGNPQHHSFPEEICEWFEHGRALPEIGKYCNMRQVDEHLSSGTHQEYVARHAFSLAYWLHIQFSAHS